MLHEKGSRVTARLMAGFVMLAAGAPVAASTPDAASGPVVAALAMSQQLADGRGLVAALGCGACHAGVPGPDSIRTVSPAFGAGAPLMAPAYVFHYLADPQTVRPDIGPARMPRYALTERERVALALFVSNDREMRGVDDALREAMARYPGADRGAGAALFGNLGCAGCHAHPEVEPRFTAPDLSLTRLRVRPEWLPGYLAEPRTIRPAGPEPGHGGQMPDFRLGPDEVSAVAAYLLELAATPAQAAGTSARAAGTLVEAAAAQVQPGDGPAPDWIDWQPLALSPFAMQKAETLLRDRWSCLGCHQLGDDGGRIGPRLDGIAERLRPSYVRALVEHPAHLAPGTIMPASLEQADRLDLVASYLVQREGRWLGSEPVAGLGADAVAADAEASPGEAQYQARCAPCHGAQGRGDGFNAQFLPVTPTVHADSAAMSLRPDDTLYDGIHAGGWILGKSHRMPAFGASLEDEQKRALVAYIRTLCRCLGPAWSRDDLPTTSRSTVGSR